ncbi:hypothetical protein Micbo1qcDRAFT_207938 [Microdochium bolleyi]|uniref:Nucleic acid-binding protein n=1 Tax=Microdochium bolleyi TaxID=196109 RepID=A0A136ISH4_9PEZI|nr:hypothetical protein Micbo1qcDRAFT_207938 [Microdochium bolleyi]
MGASFFPSVQSFYGREVISKPVDNTSPMDKEDVGDGFTSSEINEVLDPSTIDCKLPRAYEPCPIILLQPGARHYEIGGRIVNYSTHARKRQNPEESDGFWHLIVSDGSGIIGHDYQPHLGQRVTIWASFIGVSIGGELNQAPCSTSVYPGRAGTTHIVFHRDADSCELYRSPLGSSSDSNGDLAGLMTLQEFLNTGFEYDQCKILVCVRSIGRRKAVRSRINELSINLVEVGIFDHTASTMLTLWGDKSTSAASWLPNETLLLISMPKYKSAKHDARDKTAHIAISYNTTVEVDPDFARATWFRSAIRRKQKREAFFVYFPAEEWRNTLPPYGPERVLYTIAEMEERIMSDEAQSFTGMLNVMLLQANFLEHWRLGTICCTECCGVPLSANKPVAFCNNCGTQQTLFMNPRVLKTFVDESGCLAGSKLVWSEDAWQQFLLPDTGNSETEEGTPPADSWHRILELKTNELRQYEEELLYSRMTLTFGWSAGIHRLCVLAVEW